MSKKLMSKVEKFLAKKIDSSDGIRSKIHEEDHAQAVKDLKNLVLELMQAKFRTGSDNWIGVGAIVWSKRANDAFHFLPVPEKGSVAERLKSHSINLSCAQESIERLANELKYHEEENLKVAVK